MKLGLSLHYIIETIFFSLAYHFLILCKWFCLCGFSTMVFTEHVIYLQKNAVAAQLLLTNLGHFVQSKYFDICYIIHSLEEEGRKEKSMGSANPLHP